MRVCFVSPSAYGYFADEAYEDALGGGAERQLALVARELADDLDVHFVVGDYGQQRVEHHDGVTLHRSFSPQGSTLRKPLEVVQLAAAMRRADADVYVSRNKPSLATLTALVTRLLDRAWVFNVANDRFVDAPGLASLPRPLRWAYERSLRGADGLIAQTAHQRDCLADGFGRQASVVPNGYPQPDEEPLEADRRDGFLWVGRLDPEQKRPTRFLDLAERVPAASFTLVGTRGTDQFRQQIRERVAATDNVTAEFDVPPDAVHGFYRDAIALVNTSRYEGFPNTFLEAWRYGTPVVSLDVDLGKYIDDPWGFADGDFDALEAAVRTLHDDVGQRRRRGRAVRATFEAEYTINAVADRYRLALEDAHADETTS